MNDPGTQENADLYAELLDLGVDGIIAGLPAVAVERLVAPVPNRRRHIH